tara:strand:- start:292 stop:516 length:225 start_codon:yes stop_codon:yes gene_type:complete
MVVAVMMFTKLINDSSAMLVKQREKKMEGMCMEQFGDQLEVSEYSIVSFLLLFFVLINICIVFTLHFDSIMFFH